MSPNWTGHFSLVDGDRKKKPLQGRLKLAGHPDTGQVPHSVVKPGGAI